MDEVAETEVAAEAEQAPRSPIRRKLTMLPVESSNIKEIGYSAGLAGKLGNLYVRFTSGNFYAYEDVPEDVWQELLEAESKGQYFAAHIRKVYRFHKAKEKL